LHQERRYITMTEMTHRERLMVATQNGRLNVLKDLIAQTPIDIIEAFHPPPMGDMPVGEALSLWKNKVIWIGLPSSIYALGPDVTKKYALDILRDVGTGERLAVAMSTENLVSNENLLMLTSVFEKADLPLAKERVDKIERSLS